MSSRRSPTSACAVDDSVYSNQLCHISPRPLVDAATTPRAFLSREHLLLMLAYATSSRCSVLRLMEGAEQAATCRRSFARQSSSVKNVRNCRRSSAASEPNRRNRSPACAGWLSARAAA